MKIQNLILVFLAGVGVTMFYTKLHKKEGRRHRFNYGNNPKQDNINNGVVVKNADFGATNGLNIHQSAPPPPAGFVSGASSADTQNDTFINGGHDDGFSFSLSAGINI